MQNIIILINPLLEILHTFMKSGDWSFLYVKVYLEAVFQAWPLSLVIQLHVSWRRFVRHEFNSVQEWHSQYIPTRCCQIKFKGIKIRQAMWCEMEMINASFILKKKSDVLKFM